MSSGLEFPKGWTAYPDQVSHRSQDGADIYLLRGKRQKWRFWSEGEFIGPERRGMCAALAYAQAQDWRDVV